MSDVAELTITPENAGPRVRGTGMAAWIAEGRALGKLALPLIATQLSQMAIMTTDIVMLGRVDKVALAGAALGNTVFFLCWLIGMGPSAAVSPMIAHLLGARPGDRAGVRAITRMGFWSIGFLSLPLIGILLGTESILLMFDQQPELAHAAGQFTAILCFGMPFSLFFLVQRNFVTALGRPRAALIVMVMTIFFNALGDYTLIFGHFGFPALGLRGSGIATSLSYLFNFAVMQIVIQRTPSLRLYRIFRRFHRPHWAKLAEIFRLGVPIGMTAIFEAMMFNASTLIMGTFSAASVAAHQIALNVPSITFMVPLGIATAATVRVGLAAGARDGDAVRRAGYSALIMSTVFMSICSVVLIVFPRQIANLYFPADSGNGDVVALTITFLHVAAAFQIVDGIQVVAALALRGLKDARAPMWIAGGCYWLIGFPTCAILGLWLNWRGLGVWIGLAVGLTAAAVAMCWRFWWMSKDR